MNFKPGNIYHVYNQGNNKQATFYKENDYLLFLTMATQLVKPHCDIIAYCLMPTHFHFMLATDERCDVVIKQGGNTLDVLTNAFRKLLSGYCRVFNQRHNSTGSLFRQKTKAKVLTFEPTFRHTAPINDYYTNCFYYIHLNPLVSGLVTKAEDWPYSSCRDYAGLRNGTFINMRLAKNYCGYDRQYFLTEMYNRKDIVF